MWSVAQAGSLPLDAVIVQQAWSELQQLPAPWNTQEPETPTGGLENTDGRGHDLLSNAVAGDHGDTMLVHDYLPRLRKPRATRSPQQNGSELNSGSIYCHGGSR